MTSTLLLADAVRGFRPLDAAAYLRTRGWTEVHSDPGKLSVWNWRGHEGGEHETVLPLATHFRDYRARVAEFLEALQTAERRPLDELVEDLSTPNADIQRVRLPIESSWDGTLSLDEGSGVFQAIRDLVLAGASAAIEPRRAFGKRRPEQAMQHVKQARIGRSRPGSFVVAVISPLPPVVCDGAPVLESTEDEPFARSAMRTLAVALESARSGIAETAARGSLEPMQDRVVRGVSANLCDALATLQGVAHDREVEYSFSWAPTRPAPDTPALVRIPADSKALFEQVATAFRKTTEVEGVQLLGFVQKLERLSDASGLVTVSGSADGEIRRVLLELSGEQHSEAVRAYRERLEVACEGELWREGKSYRLRNPRGFRIVHQEG